MAEALDNYPFPSSLHIASIVTIKLSDRNYLLWKTQFESLLRHQKLLGFLTGQVPAPAENIIQTINNVATTVPNPNYEAWMCTDTLIKSWICGTLTEEVLGYVHFLTTSQDVWLSLADNFNKCSVAREFDLQRRFQLLSIKGKVFSVYFHEFRAFCDQLSSIEELDSIYQNHFPAWCADITEWTQRYINRTNQFNELLNAVRLLNEQRLDMLGYRDHIGAAIYDQHQHISLAVDEMWRIVPILAWTRVINFINPDLAILNSLEYQVLVAQYNVLRDQFLDNMNNDGDFNLTVARWVAADSVVQFLGRLQLRPLAGFHHAVRIPQPLEREINFSQNLSRTAKMWALLPLRRIE
ncbi:Retrovirus-related Pol polyprotein from transposon RE2 [Cardamine amara subsp. amara]|uniref:Retrovirus-related Pol polyprotein from transposon RE2 n=1 Tax=Cardamine amara subsp. amara TaxID=228776 RepID=A0ABD1AKB9_CARAN